jgi:hypothetical protein
MSAPLFSLAYFSRNSITGDAETLRCEIAAILASARRRNAACGVTGALLYSDGCFAQVLEGPQQAVEAIFETIQCDMRHHDVTILHVHTVQARSFGDWSMAFAGLDGHSIDPNVEGAGEFAFDDLVATPAGKYLVAQLTNAVKRDDRGRAELASAAAE